MPAGGALGPFWAKKPKIPLKKGEKRYPARQKIFPTMYTRIFLEILSFLVWAPTWGVQKTRVLGVISRIEKFEQKGRSSVAAIYIWRFFLFQKGGAPWKWPLFSVETKVRVHAGVAWPKKVGKLSIWISAFKIRPRRAAGGPPREVTGPRHGQVRIETHFGEFWPVMWFYAASWRTCGKYNLLNFHICLSEACFCMLISPWPDSQPF